jgi:hypothetical protein
MYMFHFQTVKKVSKREECPSETDVISVTPYGFRCRRTLALQRILDYNVTLTSVLKREDVEGELVEVVYN